MIYFFLKWYAFMSLVSVLLFYIDKDQAKNQGWRISEKHLHLSELLGGWPGVYFAMNWFKHKRQKQSYLTIYYGIIGLHLLIWGIVFYLSL
jgi:uncharacterized membrane protein YsdA (DUF1294 family)